MRTMNEPGFDEVRPRNDGYAERERLLKLLLVAEGRRQRASRNVTAREPDGKAPIPLSFAQERLWFFEQLGLAGAAYNVPLALQLNGELSEQALQRSFDEIVRRHESLRTRFEARSGVPQQVIQAPGPFELRREDFSALDPGQREHQLLESMRHEQSHRFELSTGPLLRALLVKLGDREHVLLLSMHHIVSDGWSTGVLMRELSTLYAAYLRGRPSPLQELPIQYADYAIWQRQWLRGERLAEQLEYWKTQLRSAPPELELPTDRPRPPMESFKGATLKFELPGKMCEALKELALRERATLFMVCLAAYQILLARWSGKQDIVIGSPVAGRADPQVEGLIGFFINTIVLRAEVSEQLTFRQLLAHDRELTLDAYAHQDVPFEALVKELRPDRDLSRQPVFQVSLSLQNYPEEGIDLPGLATRWKSFERTTTHFDLTLDLYEKPDGIAGAFEYATDLFNAATIERLAARFRFVLQELTARPDVPIGQLPLLPADELRHVIVEWNATAAPYPADEAVHQLFEQQVGRAPDAIAVSCEGETLTYAELNGRANQLAHYLVRQGVCGGEYIPILMRRSIRMLIAQLAVLKTGSAYVPIDVELPVDRCAFMIRDCGARRVLVDDRLPPDELHDGAVAWIDCDCIAATVESFSKQNLQTPMPRPAAAYVMYTSGSTGSPKGVVVPHHAVNNFVVNNRYARLGVEDGVAHCSNPAFDASTFEIWSALLNGARLVIVPQSVLLDAQRLSQTIIDGNVTVLFLTAGLFSQYAEALAPVFGRLRYLVTGGDVVEPGTFRRVLQNSPPRNLLNAYGPTECTTFVTTHRIADVDQGASATSIGKPISNASIYILDRHLQPAPLGASGEIYIGGVSVGLGYLNRSQLTAERFVADPFSAEPGARMYKTGDSGRWRTGGQIDFLGRNDQQVKIRGFRIELGEIEMQLVRHPFVNEAVVVVRADGPVEKALVAYIGSDGHPGAEELRSHLRASLPEYMLPSAFVVLERLPLTPNGKLDRRALPPPDAEAYAKKQYEAPQGETEQALASIWQEMLRVERIGRHDNFFELGGHSLHGMRLIAKVAERLSVRLSGIAMFQFPTISQMAQLVSSLRGVGQPAATSAPALEEGVL